MTWIIIKDPNIQDINNPDLHDYVEINAQGINQMACFEIFEDQACWAGTFGSFNALPNDKWRKPFILIS